MGVAVTHVHADDWAGLYVDGRLAESTEGHRVDLRDAFDAVQDKQVESFHSLELRHDWMMAEGRLPANLGQIPQEARIS